MDWWCGAISRFGCQWRTWVGWIISIKIATTYTLSPKYHSSAKNIWGVPDFGGSFSSPLLMEMAEDCVTCYFEITDQRWIQNFKIFWIDAYGGRYILLYAMPNYLCVENINCHVEIFPCCFRGLAYEWLNGLFILLANVSYTGLFFLI